MISAWIKHLKTKEEQERFKSAVQGSKIVFDRLKALLEEEEAELLKIENNYDNPNWDYRQADVNGFRRCLRRLQTLINLDQGNK